MYCPFVRGECKKEKCAFFRKGLRYFEGVKKPEPFEECALNVIADGIENLVERQIGVQKSNEEIRNVLILAKRRMKNGYEEEMPRLED